MKWTNEDINDLKLGIKLGLSNKEIAEILDRTVDSIKKKYLKLNLKNNSLRKTHEQYEQELKKKQPNYKVLEKYINTRTKILHKHLVCSHEWNTTPNSILSGYGCPKCCINATKTHEKV